MLTRRQTARLHSQRYHERLRALKRVRREPEAPPELTEPDQTYLDEIDAALFGDEPMTDQTAETTENYDQIWIKTQ